MGYTPPQFEVRKIGGGYDVCAPQSTTATSLVLHANTTDTYPKLVFDGAGGRILLYAALASSVDMTQGTVIFARFGRTASGFTITSTIANDDIFLSPDGSGVVKFGTHTGTGDAVSNGYITIKDAAGTARKLMTTA